MWLSFLHKLIQALVEKNENTDYIELTGWEDLEDDIPDSDSAPATTVHGFSNLGQHQYQDDGTIKTKHFQTPELSNPDNPNPENQDPILVLCSSVSQLRSTAQQQRAASVCSRERSQLQRIEALVGHSPRPS